MGRTEAVTMQSLNFFELFGNVGRGEKEMLRDNPMPLSRPGWVDLLLSEEDRPAEGQFGLPPFLVRG